MGQGVGTLALDRRLFAAVTYPTDYGFIPETIAGDGDELDAMVAVNEPTFPGCSSPPKPIALLNMHDGKNRNDKVLTVPVSEPSWSGLNDLKEMPAPSRERSSTSSRATPRSRARAGS